MGCEAFWVGFCGDYLSDDAYAGLDSELGVLCADEGVLSALHGGRRGLFGLAVLL